MLTHRTGTAEELDGLVVKWKSACVPTGREKWSVFVLDSQTRSNGCVLLFELGTMVSRVIQTTCLVLVYPPSLRTMKLGKFLIEPGSLPRRLGHAFWDMSVGPLWSGTRVPRSSFSFVTSPLGWSVLQRRVMCCFVPIKPSWQLSGQNAPRLGPFHLSSNAFVSVGSWQHIIPSLFLSYLAGKESNY